MSAVEQELKAGCELDARVAQQVLSLPHLEYGPGMKCPECGGEVDFRVRAWCFNCQGWFYSPYREYSTDIAAAWQVVEQFKDYNMQLDGHGDGWTFHIFKDATCYEADAPTAPLAICRAALKATQEGS